MTEYKQTRPRVCLNVHQRESNWSGQQQNEDCDVKQQLTKV